MSAPRRGVPPAGGVRPSQHVVYWPEMEAGWWPGLARYCEHAVCGGKMLVDYPDDGFGGRIVCVRCGRETATLVMRARPEALSELADEPVRPGRPPKVPKPQPQPKLRICVECPNEAQPDRLRCRPCGVAYKAALHRAGPERYQELLAVLRSETPRNSRQLAALVGGSHDAIRQLIRRARRNGVLIETISTGKGRRYRLREAAP